METKELHKELNEILFGSGLYLAGVENNEIKTSHLKEMEIVTLGEDVNKTKHLKESAIERTLECLKKYKAKCDELGVKEIIAKATSATRDSENRDEFIERVFKETGIKIECISGKEEGTYTFKGATLDIKDEQKETLLSYLGSEV